MKKYVAYYRISLKDENKQRGLGLLAQRTTVCNYISSNGGKLIAEYSERESGKLDNRIALNYALKECREHNATLVIAKLDRLSRNVSFVFSLRDAGVDFVACDLLQFNTLTLAVFCAMAQQERELISSRTKAALNELKRSDVELGMPMNLINNLDKAIKKSIQTRKMKALNNENNIKSFAVIQLLRENNVSLNACAKYLNEMEFLTSTSKKHTATSVKNLIQLYNY